MIQKLFNFVALVILGGAVYVGVQLVRTQTAADRYRRQLDTMTGDYLKLRNTYNKAVARTAVTELLVEHGKLAVVIRTAEGQVKRIDTPYDPAQEIYVDYVVLNGRLWIRRVFSESTPPGDGVIINPLIKDVDWDANAAAYGKAVYRRLAEGRWVVTVTGDGSLGLARAGREPKELSPPPEVGNFEPEPLNK